jgi:hypothetical protein
MYRPMLSRDRAEESGRTHSRLLERERSIPMLQECPHPAAFLASRREAYHMVEE